MIRKNLFHLLWLFIMLPACRSGHITEAWTNDNQVTTRYHKIMVAAVIREENDSLRNQVEREMVDRLHALGYNAVSATSEFGPYGLEKLSQEATYLSLCDNGIDAVLTVALVDDSSHVNLAKGASRKYTSRYFYDHLWSYRLLKPISEQSKLYWEMILFDVVSLQPQFAVQAGPFSRRQAQSRAGQLAARALQKMVKKNIMPPPDTTQRRAF